MNRQEILSALKAKPNVSVLIVGAGINGIGVFRDLALNGVDVLMVDRGDFCSGASAASSHLAHGGLRFLEHGELRLMREAALERDRLIQNAPHLVRPQTVTLPSFGHFSGLLDAPLKFLHLADRPVERGATVVGMGVRLYDSLTGGARSVVRGRAASLAKWKDLNPAAVATAACRDGLILSPERLALELLLDAEAENPNAHALNYVSMIAGAEDTLMLRDELTDDVYDVRPKLVINAAGPWIDNVNKKIGHATRFIGGVKGSHIVLDHPELLAALGGSGFLFENGEGRIMLIQPFYERVLIGTSHLPVDTPDDVRCTDTEVDTFLGMVERLFPTIQISREQIVFKFAGVRPLEHGNLKAVKRSRRSHSIQVISGEWTGLSFPIYSLIGGRWASFRAFAAQVTDKALDFLGKTRQKGTESLAIGGGRGYPRNEEELKRRIESLSAWTGLPVEHISYLFMRYGTRLEAMADSMRRAPDQPLQSMPGATRREIAFVVLNEKVIHLDDLLLRRSVLAKLGMLTRENLDELADAAGEALGWDAEQKQAEAARTLSILADRHGVLL